MSLTASSLSPDVHEQRITYQLFGEAEYPQHIPVSPYRGTAERSRFVTSVLAGEEGMVDAEESGGDDADNGDVPFEILTESMTARGQTQDVRVASMKVRTAEERRKFSDMWPPYMKVDVWLWTGTGWP